MVFSSVIFIGVFLPVFLAIYFLSPNVKFKNFVLVVFSLIFYAWGEPVWITALLFSSLIDYVNGLIIGKYPNGRKAKAALLSSLILNLGLLGVFKYSGFIVTNINTVFNISLPVPGFNLPLGISFYTFQTLSYTIDVYRGEVKTQKSFMAFLSYVSMFPQLVAGPIVRYIDIEPRINERRITVDSFSAGISRFAVGLGKKVLLANSAGSIVRYLLDGDISRLSALSGWLGIIMFTFQIYFDFSGYSDMAIGMGKMIGFDFKENFNYPYVAKSIGEFWRRWHMSLSTFFRDYVYIPLGGNRKRYVRNIAVVWFLTGLWHGASWNFVLWGIYFGVLIVLEKFFIVKALKQLPSAFSHLYSLIFIVFGWVLFYFTDLAQMGLFVSKLFDFGNFYDYTFYSTLMSHIFLLPVLLIACTSLPSRFFGKLSDRYDAFKYLRIVFNAIIIIACVLLLLGQSYNPFLYFRF